MNLSGKSIRTLLVLGGLLLAVVVSGLLGLHGSDSGSSDTQSATGTRSVSATATGKLTRAPGVPDNAYHTLAEIDAGRWPDSAGAPGTKGGDTWKNREGRLSKSDSSGKSIAYREWDANPKQRGRSRDAERIITGTDDSAYYTADHYKTFTRMR